MDEEKRFSQAFDFETKGVDANAKTLTVVMTTTRQDRQGDVVETSGIATEEFMKNPVVLWAHNMSTPPIGKVIDLQRFDNKLEGTIKFADTPLAKEIFSLYEGGFLKAWSIGFTVPPNGYNKVVDEEGNILYWHIKESELLELSAVPVPANPDALAKQVTLKSLQLKDGKLVTTETEKAFTHNSRTKDPEPKWSAVKKSELPPKAFVYDATGFDPEKKSTWKFPHHWVTNDKLYLHKGGLNAAWAAANGARSGKRAEQKVIDHLQKHRDALGLKTYPVLLCKGNEIFKYNVETDAWEFDETKTLRETALSKSLTERVAAGKVETCDCNALLPGTYLLVEAIKMSEDEKEIVEARVLSVLVGSREDDAQNAPAENNGSADGEESTRRTELKGSRALRKRARELRLMVLNLERKE